MWTLGSGCSQNVETEAGSIMEVTYLLRLFMLIYEPVLRMVLS